MIHQYNKQLINPFKVEHETLNWKSYYVIAVTLD